MPFLAAEEMKLEIWFYRAWNVCSHCGAAFAEASTELFVYKVYSESSIGAFDPRPAWTRSRAYL